MLPILYISKERRSKSTSSAKDNVKLKSSSRSLRNTAPSPSLVTISQEALSVLLTESTSSSETNSLSAHNVEPTRPSAPGHSQQGLVPSSSIAFYDTARNSPRSSSQTPSSTGATRGANSSAEEIRNPNSPLGSMSLSRGESSSNPPTQDTRSTQAHPQRPAVRHTTSAPVQQAFPRQSFPPHSFYPPHSNTETLSSSAPYPPPPPHAPPGSGYLGQYMSSQPPASLPMQPSMGYYSQAFALPGIHAHDPSAVPLPFPPPLARGYTYAGPSDSDRDTRSSSFSTSFSPSGSSGPAMVSTGRSINPGPPHHAFPPPPPPLHFPHAPSPTHYAYPVPHSYAHSSPTIYSYAPGPYSQSFYSQPASAEDTSKGGTWYYVPPSRGSQYDATAYPGVYAMQGYQPPVQMNRGDFDHQYPSASSSTAAPQSGQESLPPPDSQGRLQESSFPPPTPPALRHNLPSFSTSPRNPTPSSQSSPSPTQPKRKPIGDTMPPSPLHTSRKSYHPAPPPNRSEWVMWVGNVPSDATHDEVWRFFNQPCPPQPPETASSVLTSRLVQRSSGSSQDEKWGGVSSVFLISRSNCAFINFDSKAHLESAVAHFNGKPLNPFDPKCPRLVCRIRRKEDDLEAGVGAQRYRGLHTRWVAEQLELEKKNRETKDGPREDFSYFVDAPPTSPSTYLAASSSSSDPSPPIHAMSQIDEPHTPPRDSPSSQDDKGKGRTGSSGARSFITNSSLLRDYFPKRYFILKSLSPDDLIHSIEKGVWATQPHNEGVLDQAYRNSKDVYLIFSANKSGEFFGYARMAGPIFSEASSEEQLDSAKDPSSPRSVASRFLTPNEEQPLFESPMPTPAQNPQLAIDVPRSTEVSVQEVATAPPEAYQPHRRLSRPDLVRAVGTYPDRREFRPALVRGSLHSLRSHSPMKGVTEDGRIILDKPAARPNDKLAHSTSGVVKKLPGVQSVRSDTYVGGAGGDLGVVEKDPYEEQGAEERPGSVGRNFKVEWIRTERLPFTRTRHLRNPWNNGREVKVSRDGTELEPIVGQQLLDEWDKPAPQEPPAASPPTSPVRSRPSRTAGGGGGGGGSTAVSSSANPAHSQMGRHNRSRPLPERHRPE